MQRSSRWPLILLPVLFLLAACGSAATSQATSSPTPTPGTTPTEPIPNIPAHAVHFQTSDNIQLAGLLYGQGKTAVICSHQLHGTKTDWSDSGMPQRLAQRGYLVLAYDFRGYGESAGQINSSMNAVDLHAARDFALQQGATNIVLLGSSMGGTASLKVAAEVPVAAAITLSAPQNFGVDVSDSDVQAIRGPKLFVNSQQDITARDTTHMYAVANQPKKLQMYPGTAHGLAIFTTANSANLTQLILDFIAQYAPVS